MEFYLTKQVYYQNLKITLKSLFIDIFIIIYINKVIGDPINSKKLSQNACHSLTVVWKKVKFVTKAMWDLYVKHVILIFLNLEVPTAPIAPILKLIL